MDARLAPWALLCLSAVGLSTIGCGAASPRPAAPVAEGALPITAGARLYFESADPRAPQELTVAVVDVGSSFSFAVGCGHVEPARALASPVTGVVDGATLASGRDVSAMTRCDRAGEHDAGALPAFLMSARAMTALDHHERTMLRIANHGTAVALVPVGHESVSIRVDGHAMSIDTIHARGGGMDLWIADAGTPIVVRETDHDSGFTLAGIDTATARTPRAR
jgi:hypothetical protein